MKKYLLLLALFFIPHRAHAQIIPAESCKNNACYGFGAPTGFAPNGYIYQDMSQTPNALYCPKAGVWSACGGGASAGVATFNNRNGAVTLSAGDVNAVGSITNPTSGNAGTATALASTPTQCSGGTPVATGVAANGNANCTAAGSGLQPTNNLSDVSSVPTSRTNLGLGYQATLNFPQTSNASAAYGLHAYGDSITNGFGCTIPANCYVNQMQSDFVWTGITNKGVAGFLAADMVNAIFTNENPVTTLNPIFTTLIGTNESGHSVSGWENAFVQMSSAGYSWLTLATVNKILSSSGLATLTGTWTSDTTYTTATGETSTTNGSAVSFPVTVLNGSIYLWYRVVTTSGGTFSCTVDGTPVTDTIGGSTTISTQAQGELPTGASLGNTVQAARFAAANGTHTLLCTVSSATSGSNDVHILGIGIPPEIRYRGATAPRVFIGGVIYENTDATSAGTALYNSLSTTVAANLFADGLNAVFVDVRSYINSTIDMTGTATQNCPASTNVGLHPNDCGHRALANAFEDAINPVTEVVGTSNFRSPINEVAPAAAANFSGFDSIAPHAFGDALLKGISQCTGLFCGSGMRGFGGGFGYGTFNTLGHPTLDCYVTASPTSESSFTCPQVRWGDGLNQAGTSAVTRGTAIASATTIAPIQGFTHITGTTAIVTITPLTECTSAVVCQIVLLPDAIWTTTTGGNIAVASTAVVNKPLVLVFDPGTSKWYPNY